MTQAKQNGALTYGELKSQLATAPQEVLAQPVRWFGEEEGGLFGGVYETAEDLVDYGEGFEPWSVYEAEGVLTRDEADGYILKGTPILEKGKWGESLSRRLAREAREASDRAYSPSIRSQVQEFRFAARSPMVASPVIPPEDRTRLALGLVMDESFELMLACCVDNGEIQMLRERIATLVRHQPLQVDIVEAIDASTDIDYTTEFFRQEFGVNGEPIAAEVHRKNMEKFGPGSSFDEETGKVLKPPGWTPPDILALLREQGYQG